MTIFDDNFDDNFQIFGKILDFWNFSKIFLKNLRFFENCQIFGKFQIFWKSCDLTLDTWDTDYFADNWEQHNKQLLCDFWIKSDGDIIRNSCDVYKTAFLRRGNSYGKQFWLTWKAQI